MLPDSRLLQSLRHAAFAAFLLIPFQANAENASVAPANEYARIDTHLATETMRTLSQGSASERLAAIAKVRGNPEKYAPPVFYQLSRVLFESGERDEATFWFYAGQLRARFDANRCADPSARQAVSVLNMEFGAPINQHAFADIVKLEALITKVVEWDRNTPHDYDHRWINLHGMAAMMSALGEQNADTPALSLPEDSWVKIAEKTRTDYLAGFQEAMKRMKSG